MPGPMLRCNECDCRFELDPFDAGERRVRCPQCGAMVPVRSSGGSRRSSSGRPAGSGNKLILVLFGVFGLVGLLCCGGCGLFFWLAVKPTNFPDQTQDYADARKTYKTTLLRQGGSPQDNWQKGVPPEGVTEVTFKSGDLKLKAWVNAPPKDGPKQPAVLFLHNNFAFGSDDWNQCKPFRDAGFVTMTPMLRGENGQEGTYSLFYDEVDDVVAAGEMLAEMPGVDPNRIYIAGHSAGGTLAMLAAMTSKRFKGCASFSGSPDQGAAVRTNNDLVVPFDKTNMTELQMRSPLAFPKSFKCPARLYWGSDELFFKFSSKKLAKAAQAAGSDVQGIEVLGDHTSAVAPAMDLAINFFKIGK